jgi:hypothetical protein
MTQGAGAATMPMGAPRGFTLGRAATFLVTLWVGALLLAVELGSGPWQVGLEAGVVAGIVSGAMGLLMLAGTAGRSLNVVLVSRITAFFLRLCLVAGGLIATMKPLHGEPLGFTLAFFPLFFISTAVEHFVTAPASTDSIGGSR